MLDFKGLLSNDLVLKLMSNNFMVIKKGEGYTLLNKSRLAEAQAFIDDLIDNPEMPILNPTQFTYMLAVTRIDASLPTVMNLIRDNDLALYATCTAEMKRGKFLWDAAWGLFSSVAPMLSQVDPTLDLSSEALRSAWIQSYAI